MDWEKLDWSRSNIELAADTGYHKQYISTMRKKHGTPARRQWWLEIDWTKSDGELAAETGYSTVWIKNQRRRHAPHTMPRRAAADWAAIDWAGMSNDEIAALTGCCYHHVSAMRSQYAYGTAYAHRLAQREEVAA